MLPPCFGHISCKSPSGTANSGENQPTKTDVNRNVKSETKGSRFLNIIYGIVITVHCIICRINTIHCYFTSRETYLLTYTCCDCLSTPILVSLPVPRDFSSFFTIFTKDDPRVILWERQMNILQTQNLARGHHSKGHAGTVQFGTW